MEEKKYKSAAFSRQCPFNYLVPGLEEERISVAAGGNTRFMYLINIDKLYTQIGNVVFTI